MTTELSVYKQNKLGELARIYAENVRRLNAELVNAITIVKRLYRMRPQLRNAKVSALMTAYNANMANLKAAYQGNVANVQNFVPPLLKMTGTKKALLIGINYRGQDGELGGCIRDVECLCERIKSAGVGFVDDSIVTLTDDTVLKPTRANILGALTSMLTQAKEGDVLFFSYSGHGSYTRDMGGDEKTGYDQMIVPVDLNIILDDELKAVLMQHLKAGVTLFAMFDSCFSGSVLDLKYQYMDTLEYDKYTENSKQLETAGNVFMISGCTDKQTSADAWFGGGANGAMTWSMLQVLGGTADVPSAVTWRELVKGMRNVLVEGGFEQVPQFSTGKFENIDSVVFV